VQGRPGGLSTSDREPQCLTSGSQLACERRDGNDVVAGWETPPDMATPRMIFRPIQTESAGLDGGVYSIEKPRVCEAFADGSDGARTRDLRIDSPVL
jgi:hypothetical protein